MTVEEFQNATADQLRTKANDSFAKADQSGSLDRPGFFMEAQFYLAEIERREQQRERAESAKIARRDFWMEVSVIVLIGVEIVLALIGLDAGSREAAKQISALNSLNQSTATTASNISKLTAAQTDLITTQKNTVDALQSQVEILREQQKQRLAELTTQPLLQIRSYRREITLTSAKYQIVVQNSSVVAAKGFVIYFKADSGAVKVLLPDSQASTSNETSIYVPLLGPRSKQDLSLALQYPVGMSPFHIHISSSGENIPAKSLGDILIRPPVR